MTRFALPPDHCPSCRGWLDDETAMCADCCGRCCRSCLTQVDPESSDLKCDACRYSAVMAAPMKETARIVDGLTARMEMRK